MEIVGRRGFSLIEVIIALGMLAGVLIAISSMFVLGARQVKAGRSLTAATTLAHDLMESFAGRSFSALPYDLGAAPTDASVTVDSRTAGGAIEGWQGEIDRELHDGFATVGIQALGRGRTSFVTADAIRVTASVTWSERGRSRTVALSTVRF